MLFVSAAHSFLRLIIALLLLKNVARGARQIERRSLFFGSGGALDFNSRPGIRYAIDPTLAPPPSPPPTAASLSLTPAAVFSHQIYHDYNQQPWPPRSSLGAGGLIPISYGSYGNSAAGGYPLYSNNIEPTAQVPTTTDHHFEEEVEPYYYHGDRILKQYLVSEKSKHDLLIDNHLGNPFKPPPILRYETRRLPFGGIVDVPVFDTNNFEQQLHPFKPSTLRKNHGAIALGSGSLGLISLPNGNVYLGSGSLGYVSEKQHLDTLVKPTTKPFLIAGPLHFGTNVN